MTDSAPRYLTNFTADAIAEFTGEAPALAAPDTQETPDPVDTTPEPESPKVDHTPVKKHPLKQQAQQTQPPAPPALDVETGAGTPPPILLPEDAVPPAAAPEVAPKAAKAE